MNTCGLLWSTDGLGCCGFPFTPICAKSESDCFSQQLRIQQATVAVD